MIDDKDKIVVGNTIPEVTYSFGVHMGWKGLSLEAQFQGVGEVYTYPRANLAVPFNNGAGVTRDWATDSWTESNRHSKLPLLTTYTDAPENFIPSTKWLRNASYLRMKNIQLTYDFPKRLLRPLRIEALPDLCQRPEPLDDLRFRSLGPGDHHHPHGPLRIPQSEDRFDRSEP